MEVLKYCKLQIGILLVLLFINYVYVKDGERLNRKSKQKKSNIYFDCLFIFAEFAIMFDGITMYTVNHLDQIPRTVNLAVHLVYLLVYQYFIFAHFMYWLSVTKSIPDELWKKVCYVVPIILSSTVTIVFLPQLDFHVGKYTNYSFGVSAVSCFAVISIYDILTLLLIVIRHNYLQRNKRIAFVMANVTVCGITLIQMIHKEALISCIAVILVIVSLYICMENPTIKYLEFYHDEMVTGFATLVESKDGSTGGHIRRSSAYAVLIAEELRKNPKYKNHITKDYIDQLKKAAPMHDIGKIGVPDSVLQKPGKLTAEEYDIMKKHPEIGGEIIEETFGHLDDDEYENMAYKVAMGHHEKWNGKGYPKQLAETEIPLSARIMAVADVFDAVSAKRCYRDAMPLEKCYQIIEEGRGTDFDPDVVDAFFAGQEKVEQIYGTKDMFKTE